MDYRKVGFWQLVILALLLNFIAQIIHEAGHWAVYETLGRGPVWGFTGLVQIWGNPPPLHPNEWIAMIAPDGESAMNYLQMCKQEPEKHQKPCLILLDLNMPGIRFKPDALEAQSCHETDGVGSGADRLFNHEPVLPARLGRGRIFFSSVFGHTQIHN